MADVTVEYVFGAQKLANVEILVEQDPGGQAKLIAALPCLPLGTYRVNWVLVPGPGVTDPRFDETDGIQFVTVPPQVSITNSHRKPDNPGVWEADISNQVVGANTAHYFANGTINGSVNGSANRSVNGALAFTREHFDHDPTVAVTPDPPPGG